MLKNTFEWTLTAYEHQGNLWLTWNTSAPFRALQGQFRIYRNKAFPINPEHDTLVWEWNCGHLTKPWDTGLVFEHGMHCAWVSENTRTGSFAYLAKTVTELTMGGRVTYGLETGCDTHHANHLKASIFS